MHADNYSTADFASNDPYAVPPLPHLNPNQPYRDDPTAAGAYYDPYRGPVPGTIDHGTGEWHGEAIPMQQIQHQQTGGGFAGGGYDQVGPAPTMAPPYQQGGHDGYDGSVPPQVGRQSPGPQQAYGGRISPGPNMAYNAGYNQGPAPGYHDGYGPR
ncbi:hypothetical protein FA13DRAFT_1738538 [Coprinellus micaceus]|uniref:Uncharacterized protein n=1 Tax=Coprinellus micaceus TaxID=71717 RepID=A0A4Y7STD6_COPMI|nr:hypothetical protein FA13DRAFT_1738538 [Coprinellus micaceus]